MKPDLLISLFLRNRRRRGALPEEEPSLGHPKCRVPWPRSVAQPGKRKRHLPHFSAGKAAGSALRGTAPGAPGSVWGTALCPAVLHGPRHPQPLPATASPPLGTVLQRQLSAFREQAPLCLADLLFLPVIIKLSLSTCHRSPRHSSSRAVLPSEQGVLRAVWPWPYGGREVPRQQRGSFTLLQDVGGCYWLTHCTQCFVPPSHWGPTHSTLTAGSTAGRATSGVLSGVGVSPGQEEPAHTSPPLKALSHFLGVPRSNCISGWTGPRRQPGNGSRCCGSSSAPIWEEQIPSVPKAPLPAVSPTPAVGASQISAASWLILTLLLLCFLQTSPV